MLISYLFVRTVPAVSSDVDNDNDNHNNHNNNDNDLFFKSIIDRSKQP